MTWELILAAFGGGVFGAVIGALPAFIFAGFVGLIGVGVIAAGGPPTILNDVVFGTLFGPHIAFAGGVAAAAFAANKKKSLENGADIVTPLAKTNDLTILLVGGMFGIIGYLVNYGLAFVETPIDTVALTVFISGVIARFVFGKTGLIGKYTPTNASEKRAFVPDAKSLGFIIVYSLGFGLVISYLVDLTQINTLGFVISAATLIFVQFGFNIPATHHVTLVAGYATIATGSILIGALFAVIAGVLGELVGRTLNTYVDTHVDPPATVIAVCSLFIFTLM